MNDPFDLARFLNAQGPAYDAALRELRAGRKRTHWMWFVFPQLRGLGRSATARYFGIASLAEARAYLEHPELGARLRECVAAVAAHAGTSLREIFGSPDDLKFRSSMTLFAAADNETSSVFDRALACFANGEPDMQTRALLEAEDA